MTILTQFLFWLSIYFLIIIASWVIDDVLFSLDSRWHTRFENFKKQFRGFM
jgi:hypothetical protein